ncbi:MAG: hypothetical protein Q7W55_03545 [Pseudohongiella sp.]|nr:hypothetical protein [Pseudohongiella sp.]
MTGLNSAISASAARKRKSSTHTAAGIPPSGYPHLNAAMNLVMESARGPKGAGVLDAEFGFGLELILDCVRQLRQQTEIPD